MMLCHDGIFFVICVLESLHTNEPLVCAFIARAFCPPPHTGSFEDARHHRHAVNNRRGDVDVALMCRQRLRRAVGGAKETPRLAIGLQRYGDEFEAHLLVGFLAACSTSMTGGILGG